MSGRTPSAASSASAPSKSPRTKRVSHGASCGELLEALRGRRVTVDAISEPVGADPLGEQARVAAGPEGAVDDGLARPRAGLADDLRGEDWYVLGRHVGECRHPTARSRGPAVRLRGGEALGQLRRPLLVLLVLREPLLRRPDLEPRADAGDDAASPRGRRGRSAAAAAARGRPSRARPKRSGRRSGAGSGARRGSSG